jgi:hypothetical protein
MNQLKLIKKLIKKKKAKLNIIPLIPVKFNPINLNYMMKPLKQETKEYNIKEINMQ